MVYISMRVLKFRYLSDPRTQSQGGSIATYIMRKNDKTTENNSAVHTTKPPAPAGDATFPVALVDVVVAAAVVAVRLVVVPLPPPIPPVRVVAGVEVVSVVSVTVSVLVVDGVRVRVPVGE